MALAALDCGRGWRDGRVCRVVATGHQKDAALHGLYVQRDEHRFCAAVFGPAVWRVDYLEQCHRNGDHYCWNCIICTMQVIFSILWFPFYGKVIFLQDKATNC